MSGSPKKHRVVAEKDVLAIPRGGEMQLPYKALVTPLARQAAIERKITLVQTQKAPSFGDNLYAEIVRVGKLLYQKNFIVATDGNISARLPGDRLLVTPSGCHKGFMNPEDLVITDMNGQVLDSPSGFKPTSEMPMHLEIYRQRPDVNSVVHSHLPTAVALSIAGVPLDQPFLPEAILTLGPAPTTEYATPSSLENVTAIRDLIADHNAIILRRHGAITVGADPFDAFMRMESVEHKAHIIMMLQLLGRGEPLPQEQVAKLLELRKQYGVNVSGK
jgi:L-fuculose-phosphate aldolase